MTEKCAKHDIPVIDSLMGPYCTECNDIPDATYNDDFPWAKDFAKNISGIFDEETYSA